MFKEATLALASCVSLALLATPLSAADVSAADPGHAYIQLNGAYAFGDAGSGILSGNPGADGDFKPGDGIWGSAYLGYATSSGWDWRVGIGGADLSQGKLRGNAAIRIFGVDDATMFNLDGDVGYTLSSGDITIRPSLGVRYLGWQQDQGYHPDAPLGCCGLNTDFEGIGPKLGLDATVPMSGGLSVVGGAEVSALFGSIDYNGGPQYNPTKDSDNRTAFSVGGYAGIDWALNEQLTIGARYNVLWLDGTSYKDAGLIAQVPNGRGTNLLHGPSLNLLFAF